MNARAAAEALFVRPLGTRIAKIDESAVPAEAWQPYLAMPERVRKIAFRLYSRKTLAEREQVWREVPMLWRAEAGRACVLLLGAVYGTVNPYSTMLSRIADEVPAPLVADTIEAAGKLRRLGREGR